MVLKRYWPAVSQICMRIFLPSISSVLILKSMPIEIMTRKYRWWWDGMSWSCFRRISGECWSCRLHCLRWWVALRGNHSRITFSWVRYVLIRKGLFWFLIFKFDIINDYFDLLYLIYLRYFCIIHHVVRRLFWGGRENKGIKHSKVKEWLSQSSK